MRRLPALIVLVLPAGLMAQSREVQHHRFDDPEGRLMGFYAAALAFSGIGPALTEAPWTVGLGLEATYIPRLSREQRTAGLDKPESSNLSPVVPRPRVSLSAPGGVRIEASWVPPVPVFDARANLYGLALSKTMFGYMGMSFTPRLAASGGRARGAITCNEDLLGGLASERLYFAAICHSRESDDHLEPRQLSGELLVSRSWSQRRVTPFVGVGARRDDVRFDIGVKRADGSRDADHPVLRMRSTRPFFVAGATWNGSGRTSAGGELYYAPGSLVTVRVRVDLDVHRGTGG
jgi:hypothetical protein